MQVIRIYLLTSITKNCQKNLSKLLKVVYNLALTWKESAKKREIEGCLRVGNRERSRYMLKKVRVLEKRLFIKYGRRVEK